MPHLKPEFVSLVQSEFPDGFMTQSAEELQAFGQDWTRDYRADPSAIAFPRTTDEVARILRFCNEHRVPVVPSGGRTGLAGGAVAAHGELVLNLNRMNRMNPVDTLAQTVRVQAGAVTEAVHQHCAAQGLTWPIDFAAKGSSQIGGNISTNAGGLKVIHYGLCRQWVLGLQVVTMAGEILELNGALEKNNTGLDLRQLFIGTEGTLGVITEATLKLTRLPSETNVFLFALRDIPAVLRFFHEVRKAPFTVMAFEFLTRNCLELVTSSRNLKRPFETDSEASVLVEIARPASPDSGEILDQWLAGLFEQELVLDGTLAQSPREARDLWAIREGISESLGQKGFVHKNDIALPVSELEDFISDLYRVFRQKHSQFEIYLFGHIGDGNLHINTMKPESMDQEMFLERCHAADQDLFQLVQEHQGSVSAEHGIGLLKKKALRFSRTPQEIEYFRAIKKVFDPHGLLNPGKIID